MEFGYRLNQAVEGHPQAPASTHGRQKWLLDRLKAETGLDLSPNTVHKWINGMSRPREDKIRALAKVLSVDEVWLTLGRKPAESPRRADEQFASAHGAVLLLAGLVEIAGGRVAFKPEEGAHLVVNIRSSQFEVLALTPQSVDKSTSFIVPEPVRTGVRIVGVLRAEHCESSACVDLFDLSDVPRQRFGGFSIIQVERRKDRRFKLEGRRELLSPLASLDDLVS